MIASLAAIEEPPELEGIGDATPNACEKGPAVGAGAFPSGEPAGIKKYLRHISSAVKVNLAAFGFFALLSRMGILSESYVESGHVYCVVGVAFSVLSSIPQKGLLFDFPSNAITHERSRARRHLRDEGGRWSVFRGFDIFLGYLLLTVVGVILAGPGSAQESVPFPAYILVRLCLGLPLTNLHMACVHAAISKPSTKPLRERIPGWHAWITIAPAAALDIVLPACAHLATSQILEFLCQSFSGATGAQASNDPDSSAMVYGLMALAAIPYISSFAVSAVTRVVYTRVSAALLPEDDELTVPFDRSFGGRVDNDSAPPLVVLSAWRSLSPDNYMRYLSTVVDVARHEAGGLVLLFCIVFAEVALFAPCTVLEYLMWFADVVLRYSGVDNDAGLA